MAACSSMRKSNSFSGSDSTMAVPYLICYNTEYYLVLDSYIYLIAPYLVDSVVIVVVIAVVILIVIVVLIVEIVLLVVVVVKFSYRVRSSSSSNSTLQIETCFHSLIKLFYLIFISFHCIF